MSSTRPCATILIVFAVLSQDLQVCAYFTLSSDDLTSQPTPHVCPDSVIQLNCHVTNFERYDVFRWFIDTGPNSEFAHIAIDDDIVAPQRLEVMLDWLTGVEVYIVNILYNEENNSYSFQSTVSLNTSLYSSNITRHVSCGLFNSMSNNISLGFLILNPQPPQYLNVIAIYKNDLINTLTAHWDLQRSSASGNLSCSSSYFAELKERVGNSTVLLDYKLVHFSECGKVNCSATFQLSPNLNELGDIVISVLATDRLLKHNSTALTFENVVAVSSHAVLNYTVLTPTSECSPVSLSCQIFQPEFHSCKFSYRLSQSEDEYSQQLILANSSTTLPHIKALDPYEYILSLESESGTLSLQSLGTFSYNPDVARLTSANEGLLSFGVLLFVSVLALMGVDMFLLRRSFQSVPRVLKVLFLSGILQQVVLLTLMVTLYIATGSVVSSQEDLCDSGWKSARNGLIISTFLFALYLLVVSAILTLLLLYINYKDYLYNFYYSKKKPVTAITTTPTNGDTPDQLETTVEESDSMNSHGVYYMKKNQLYNPEFFNGPSISEARPSEGLYDIPEDPDSGPQDLQDGGCHIYDDMDKSMDANNKITTNIYDMPFEAAECDAAQLQQKKEKFYESVVEEDSDEEDGNKDETEETKRMNQELNERQITEANMRRRQENMRLGMDRSLINQSSKMAGHEEDGSHNKWLYDSSND